MSWVLEVKGQGLIMHYAHGYCGVGPFCRDVNKDQAFKAKDLAFKAKDKARTFRCNPAALHWLFDTIDMAH